MPRPYKKGLRSTVYSRQKVETARGVIEAERLLNLLHDNALGKIELDALRLKSIEILLRKALPDLSAVEMAIDQAQPFALIPDTVQDVSAWEQASDPLKAKH